MIDLLRQMLTGQYEAALAMLNQCVQACPPQHWEGRIANDTFRQIAYHTLFCTDLYLSRTETEFELRELHRRGGDERDEGRSPGLSQEETAAYAEVCRQKAIEVVAAETAESLAGPSGFSRKFSRAEMHVYNIRHVQHHAGQFSAYLRRVDEACRDPNALPWIGSGWR